MARPKAKEPAGSAYFDLYTLETLSTIVYTGGWATSRGLDPGLTTLHYSISDSQGDGLHDIRI